MKTLADGNHESLKLAQHALELSGIPMHFPEGFFIRGLPGQSIPMLADFHNPYDVPDQNFTMQVLSHDITKHSIKPGKRFSLYIHGIRYDFKIRHAGAPDMTGWTKLDVDYVEHDDLEARLYD